MIMLWSDFLQIVSAVSNILIAYFTYKSIRKKGKK